MTTADPSYCASPACPRGLSPWSGAWLLLLALGVPLPGAAAPGDIIGTDPSLPAVTVTLPGTDLGQRVLVALRQAQGLVQGGVAEAARPGLVDLYTLLQRLDEGEQWLRSDQGLPASYRTDAGLWLPVRAQRVRVWLDVPVLEPRPQDDGAPSHTVPALALRTAWLPVTSTQRLVGDALRALGAGDWGLARAHRDLAQALAGVQVSLALDDRRLIDAFLAVEDALAGNPPWSPSLRARMVQGAVDLQDLGLDALGRRLREAADRSTADPEGLEGLARALREQLVREARGTDQAADSDDT
jgi:hypothetical protein